MGHDTRHFRHLGFQELLDIREVLDARDHVKALPATVMFAEQCFADGDRVEFGHIGADGEAIHWRRADDRQVPHARQRQLQRARDRRGGQRQHMHVRAQLLEPLFMRDAEMLFLVDDQKAKVLKPDTFGQKRMGADDDIGCPA